MSVVTFLLVVLVLAVLITALVFRVLLRLLGAGVFCLLLAAIWLL